MRRPLIIAVSGGIDSVVLLDLIVRQYILGVDNESSCNRASFSIAVAHIDHGIRTESAADARFVEALAQKYGLEYVSIRYELGSGANEEIARKARYDFLLDQASIRQAVVVTAHHADDVIGSIAINIIRGTGWRGVAVMNRPQVIRPLKNWTKLQIYDYALQHRLEWVEDETNHSNRYLRNRLRAELMTIDPGAQKRLLDLRGKQITCLRQIDNEARKLVRVAEGSRYFYSNIPDSVALELIRQAIRLKAGYSPLRESCQRALLAIKTARTGTIHNVAAGVSLVFSRDQFVVETHPK